MNREKQMRPFGIRDKLGYLFGDFGNDFTFILSTMVLMKFYTDVVGISAGAVGTIMMAARFVDAFTDVTMGRLCDRSRVVPGAGKFRPWILRMCVPVAASSFLMYWNGAARLPYAARVIYLLVTYILWGSVFYTAINIPYGSMASAITSDPRERQSLSTYRSMGAALAGTFIGVLLPAIAYEKIDGTETLIGSRVTMAAGLFSLLAIAAYLLCYALTRERVTPCRQHESGRQPSAAVMLRGALKNRALISIIAASVVMLLAQLTMQNMGGYIYPDYYNNAGAQSASTVLMMGGMLLSAALAGPLAARFGKAELAAASNLFAGAVAIGTFLLRPGSVWVFVGLQTLGWLGLGLFSMVSWALITDVIDDSELQNGVREDGAIYAMYSFARKMGQALAAGVSGWLLTLIGYIPGASGGQTQTVLSGIFAIATLVPALGFILLAAALWWWYPLHKRQVDENAARLKEKRAGRHDPGTTCV
ncbi:MAG: MFS transporter [Clostridia bacterium]|nr:MFS transporter [Clostridia bacterium]